MNYTISISRNGDGTLFLSLYINNKRYRVYSGKPIGVANSPNKLPPHLRLNAFEDLKLDYQLAIRNGWTPESVKNDKKDQGKIAGPITTHHLWSIYNNMKEENYSGKYLKDLLYYVRNISNLAKEEITEDTFTEFLSTKKHWSNTSYNNARRYIRVLEERLREFGYTGNWEQNNKSRRATQKLHKPFTNVEEVLEDIYKF